MANIASQTSTLRVRVRNGTLLAGSSMTIMAAAIISPALPGIETAFRSYPNIALWSRLALTLPALLIAISAPVVGLMLDRWGRRPVLLLALTLFGVAGSSGFWASSLPMLLAGRALLGVAVAGITGGFTTLIGDYFSGSQLNRFMGWQGAVNSFSGTLFLLAAGGLADVSWRYPFLLYAAGLLLVPLVYFTADEPNFERDSGTAASAAPLPTWTVARIYLLGFAFMAIFYMVPVQLPFYLTGLGVTGSLVGAAIALMALIGGLGALNYARFRKQLTFQQIYWFVFILMAAGYAVIGLANSYLIVLAGLAIAGLGMSAFVPNSNVWLVSLVTGRVRGRAVGGLSTSFYLGQFASPLLVRPVEGAIGLGNAFLAGAGLLLLLSLPFLKSLHAFLRGGRTSRQEMGKELGRARTDKNAPTNDNPRLWIDLKRAVRMIEDQIETKFLDRTELASGWYPVLDYLADAPADGPMMNQVADALFMSPSGLSRLLDRMVASGLVARVPDQADRRVVRAQLTREGRAVHAKAREQYALLVQQEFERRLSPAERTALDNIVQRLAARGEDPVNH